MVVKEALACNLPIVSVDVGDVAERIRGLAGCRIVPPEPASIASALADVLSTGARSDGRATANRVSIGRIADQLVTIYRGVLGS